MVSSRLGMPTGRPTSNKFRRRCRNQRECVGTSGCRSDDDQPRLGNWRGSDIPAAFAIKQRLDRNATTHTA
jgi:hypothetical protein